MLSKVFKARTLLAALVLLTTIAVLINRDGTVSVHAGGSTAVIVELRDDPGAVYKARTEKSGGSVSQEELQGYRNNLRARQDEFLNALSASSVGYSVMSRDVKNYDGTLAATVQLRYTLVYN